MPDAARRLEQRRRDARTRNAQRWGLLVLAFVASIALGCGSDSAQMSAPTPTPVITPQPVPTPLCGNGIIDDGEFCDGEPFCVNCGVPGLSGCCDFSSPVDGERICIDIGLAGAQACIQNTPGGNFSIGSTCAGDPCDDVVVGCHRSVCETETIAPVSLCCQRTAERCTASIVTNISNLASFVALDCNNTGEETAVVGTCGADGRCVPGH